jgi:hypothetical protein
VLRLAGGAGKGVRGTEGATSFLERFPAGKGTLKEPGRGTPTSSQRGFRPRSPSP